MMNFLNLIRYKNLLFIVGLQLLMRYAVIQPILKVLFDGPSYYMTDLQFALLVASTVFIAAAGYVINDYFDTRIDEINHPDSVIVGKSITKERAALIHHILAGLGVVMGLIVAFWCKSLSLGLIIVMVPGMLWFYSASYKRQFLVGNIIVAINSALLPLVVVMAEIAFLNKNSELPISEAPNGGYIIPFLYAWVGGFSVFTFLATLIREIIKDMEDEKGDREMESRSMPIVWGIKNSKIVVYGLIAFTIATLLHIEFRFINEFPLFKFTLINQYPYILEVTERSTLSLRYIIFGIIIPFGYLVYLLIKAKNKIDFHQASNFMKFVMIIGSLYALIFYFLLCKVQGIAMFDLFFVK